MTRQLQGKIRKSNRITKKSQFRNHKYPFFHEIKKHGVLYLMALPGIMFLFVFNYLPIFGTIIAFKKFNYKDGIFGSPWAGFENFKFLMSSSQALQAIYNTIVLNFIFILVSTLVAITFALLLNEVKNKIFKKVTQSIILMPYFLSWIVINVIVYSIFNYEHGSLNTLLRSLSIEPINIYINKNIWPPLLTFIYSWKRAGFTMVIYLAVLTGVNSELYEASMIDGASKLKQIWFISIPMLMPTVIILTTLAIGKILNADFGMFYSIVGNNSVVYKTADVIDTFVYRVFRDIGDIGMSSAVAFTQSIAGFVLVMSTNMIIRKLDRENALF